MFGYLYGTESVQAGSAKISKTLAPLNIHFYLWLFKVFIFQCYTQEWWISCSKLEQPNPCSFLLVRICTFITEYLPLRPLCIIHSRNQLLRQASSILFLQNLSSQPVASFYLVLAAWYSKSSKTSSTLPLNPNDQTSEFVNSSKSL